MWGRDSIRERLFGQTLLTDRGADGQKKDRYIDVLCVTGTSEPKTRLSLILSLNTSPLREATSVKHVINTSILAQENLMFNLNVRGDEMSQHIFKGHDVFII